MEARTKPFDGMMLVGLAVLALVVAPAVVPPVALLFLFFSFDHPVHSLRVVPELAFVLFTFPGLYGYGFGFVACLILGVPLTFVAEKFAELRPIGVWTLVGALGGAGIAALYSNHFVISGVITGATTALIFRLIVGFGLANRDVEQR